MQIEDLSIEDLVKMRDQLVEVLADKVRPASASFPVRQSD